MTLQKVYNILRKSDLSDFYIPKNIEEAEFIYIDDVSLSISKNKEEKQYSYDYFYKNDKEKIDLPDYESFVREVCEVDNFLTCCGSIYHYEWIIKYNNQIIYIINSLNIYNPSSIDFIIPFNMKIYDFEFNFLKMVNESLTASKYYQAEEIIDEKVIRKESVFDDFLYNDLAS